MELSPRNTATITAQVHATSAHPGRRNHHLPEEEVVTVGTLPATANMFLSITPAVEVSERRKNTVEEDGEQRRFISKISVRSPVIDAEEDTQCSQQMRQSSRINSSS